MGKNQHELLEILDTAGTEQFIALRDLYYRSGEGFVLVASLINKFSFSELVPIVEGIKRAKDNADVPIVLLLNKKDLIELDPQQRAISKNDIDQFCAKYNISAAYECSAKSGFNIDVAFLDVARRVNQIVSPQKKMMQKKRRVPGCNLL